MRKLLFLIFASFLQTSIISQTIDLTDNKKYSLKGSDYTILLPRGFKIEKMSGTDFLGYNIEDKNNKDKTKIWLYLGYFPKSMADIQLYSIIDSIKKTVMCDTVTFKIFKSNQDYLIEGFIFDNYHIIKTEIYFDKPLQLYMWGKTTDLNSLDTIIRILQTLELQLPAANKRS